MFKYRSKRGRPPPFSGFVPPFLRAVFGGWWFQISLTAVSVQLSIDTGDVQQKFPNLHPPQHGFCPKISIGNGGFFRHVHGSNSFRTLENVEVARISSTTESFITLRQNEKCTVNGGIYQVREVSLPESVYIYIYDIYVFMYIYNKRIEMQNTSKWPPEALSFLVACKPSFATVPGKGKHRKSCMYIYMYIHIICVYIERPRSLGVQKKCRPFGGLFGWKGTNATPLEDPSIHVYVL